MEERSNETGRPGALRTDMGIFLEAVPALLVPGVAFLVVSSVLPTRTRGSTRSCRVEWEQRAAEIDAVVGGAAVEKPGAAGTSHE